MKTAIYLFRKIFFCTKITRKASPVAIVIPCTEKMIEVTRAK